MSFVGAVSSWVRKSLGVYAASVGLPALVCGAGNFTVPSVLRSGGYRLPIRACDVSLYSCALGAFLSDGPLDIAQSPDCPPDLRGLLRTGSPLDAAASLALLFDLREVWQEKNLFQARAMQNARDNWEGLLERSREGLRALKRHIGPIAFEARDGFELLEASDPGHAVFAFPPTYRRGYEKLEKMLRAVAAWTPPRYREMTDQSLELYHAVARFEEYFVVLEKELPEVFAILGDPVAVLPRGRTGKTFILARRASPRIVIQRKAKSEPSGPVWPPDKAISGLETPGLGQLTLAQTIRFNELFLSKRINYFTGGVGLSLAFLLDGQAIGKADFCPSSHQWKLPGEGAMIYLMCDLAVPSTEKRLAKLVLALLLSSEVKQLVDRRWIGDFRWAITTAFSTHPVSMKYRGVFKLHKRKPREGVFALNYFAPLGELSMAETFARWAKKNA
jgi:hypothetical protein